MKNKTSILLLFLTFLLVNVGNATAQQKHEYVDLGLPSGTLWAACNIGAANPEDYGDYFAWGETSTKSDYTWGNYKYCRDYDSHKLTKYVYLPGWGYNGFTDQLSTIEKSDDVAYQKWGSDWCMPTWVQFFELEKNCTWTWTSRNGKNGYEVKGRNGNTIFLPAAGEEGRWDVGARGYYWSSSRNKTYSENAEALCITSSEINEMYSSGRNNGYSVRPVRFFTKVKSQSTEHKYIDLGLPSGTLWATTNVGAFNPEDAGNYFAWGETKPKFIYSKDNYTSDNLTTLGISDDAAAANWGSDWCMPTQEQWQELKDCCTCTWTDLNGWNGYRVKGPNGNTIFLPAVGHGGDKLVERVWGFEEWGNYWSSTCTTETPACAFKFYFQSDMDDMLTSVRYSGLSVRPVWSKKNTALQSQSTGDNEILQFQSQSAGTQYVNLGLPSGTLWATCNVGADNSWDYGDYYAWGETTAKFTYLWSNYKHGNGSDSDISKKYNETDNRTTLEKSDDAATANLGSDWCMPTESQFKELYDNCTSEWITSYQGKGVAGRIFKSKKNGNTIFFPAAGYKDNDGKTYNVGSNGRYWSSSLDLLFSDFAQSFTFVSDHVYPDGSGERCEGHPVRAVRSKN